MLLKEYLSNEAYFPSPPPRYTQRYSTDVNDIEASLIRNEWRPTSARQDAQLVDSLIQVLEDHIENIEAPSVIETFDVLRAQHVRIWTKNEYESDASVMVSSGALGLALNLLIEIGSPFEINYQRPASGYGSKVDCFFTKDGRTKAVVDLKSPGVFKILVENLLSRHDAFEVKVQAGATNIAAKVINKLCLYMGSHQTEWGVLTCHDKWVFVRLHRGTDLQRAYITFSSVEEQSNNTKPFRALLGLLLASNYGTDVPSHANMQTTLTTIIEENQDQPSSPSRSSQGSLFDPTNEPRPREEVQRVEPSPLRGRDLSKDTNPDIVLSWSPTQTSSDVSLNLYLIAGVGDFPSLGSVSTRLWIQRMIGAGSTGSVYEAKLDAYGQTSQSYAIKAVKKGNSEEAKARVLRLYREVDVYRALEDLRASGRKVDVVPRCYGLYETNASFLLVMDYVGETLPGLDFKNMKYMDKITFFKAISDLHALGINHCDLSPRNVVRHPDGTFRIIDFTQSYIHKCAGIQGMKGTGRNDQTCTELTEMWKRLVKTKRHMHNIIVS